MPSIRSTTGLSRPSANRLAEYLRFTGVGLTIILIEIALARGAVAPELSRFVVLFLTLLGVAFVFRFPLVAALALFAMSDFIFHATFFAFSIGPLAVRPHEVVLLALLGVALVAPERRTWGGVAGASLAAFLGLVAASAALALWSDAATASDVVNWGRPLGLLTFFYVVVRLFPGAQERRTLLMGTAVFAALTGLVAVLVSLGAGFGDSLQGAGESTIRAQEGGSLDRVRLAGLSAGYGLFWYAVAQLVAHRGALRLAWGMILLGIMLDILISYNRNMWVGVMIGFVLMAIIGGAIVRTRLAIAVAVVVAGVALVVAFGSTTASSNRFVAPLVERGATILDPDEVTREASFNDRAEETRVAWRTARENLLLGVGVGAPFGPLVIKQIGPQSFELSPQLFLHNQYLYLLLIAGIPGLLAFIIFLGLPLVHSFRRWPPDPSIAACGVGIALIMISAVVAIYFSVDDMTAVLALLAGVLVADREGPAPAGQASGLL